jgi:ArsR family transcriptional regulator
MEETTKILRALADPTRLRIMLLLLEQELCVCELESVLSMEQSRISHALRTLRYAELIDERREGRWVFYKTARELPDTLASYLKESAADNGQALDDRERAARLLESDKPRGKRCTLRDKR